MADIRWLTRAGNELREIPEPDLEALARRARSAIFGHYRSGPPDYAMIQPPPQWTHDTNASPITDLILGHDLQESVLADIEAHEDYWRWGTGTGVLHGAVLAWAAANGRFDGITGDGWAVLMESPGYPVRPWLSPDGSEGWWTWGMQTRAETESAVSAPGANTRDWSEDAPSTPVGWLLGLAGEALGAARRILGLDEPPEPDEPEEPEGPETWGGMVTVLERIETRLDDHDRTVVASLALADLALLRIENRQLRLNRRLDGMSQGIHDQGHAIGHAIYERLMIQNALLLELLGEEHHDLMESPDRADWAAEAIARNMKKTIPPSSIARAWRWAEDQLWSSVSTMGSLVRIGLRMLVQIKRAVLLGPRAGRR